MDLPGRRKRGRPQRRFLDVVKEDMERAASDRMKQSQMSSLEKIKRNQIG